MITFCNLDILVGFKQPNPHILIDKKIWLRRDSWESLRKRVH